MTLTINQDPNNSQLTIYRVDTHQFDSLGKVLSSWDMFIEGLSSTFGKSEKLEDCQFICGEIIDILDKRILGYEVYVCADKDQIEGFMIIENNSQDDQLHIVELCSNPKNLIDSKDRVTVGPAMIDAAKRRAEETGKKEISVVPLGDSTRFYAKQFFKRCEGHMKFDLR